MRHGVMLGAHWLPLGFLVKVSHSGQTGVVWFVSVLNGEGLRAFAQSIDDI